MSAQNSQEFRVGQLVTSFNFGIGRIVDITTMGGPNQFYVIEDGTKGVKHFIPLQSSGAIRTLVEPEQIKKIVESLAQVTKAPDFPSKKDRIAYFKEAQSHQNLEHSVKLIKELNQIKDKGTLESKLQQDLMGLLAHEFSYVVKESEESQFSLIREALNQSLSN